MPTRSFKNLQKAKALARKTEANNNPQVNGATEIDTIGNLSIGDAATGPDTTNAVAVRTEETRSVNLVSMGPIERKALVSGPMVDIQQDSNTLIQISRGLFTAASSKGASLVTVENKILVPVEIDKTAVKILIKWINKTTTYKTVWPMISHRKLAAALNLNRAAEFLGLTLYIEEVVKGFRSFFSNKTPSILELTTIEDLSRPKDDPFVSFVAGRVAHLIRRGDQAYDDAYVTGISVRCRKIYAAIRETNEHWDEEQRKIQERSARRDEATRAHLKRMSETSKNAARQAARMEKQKKVAVTRDAVITKLQSKVHSLTQDELDLANRLRKKGDREIMKLM